MMQSKNQEQLSESVWTREAQSAKCFGNIMSLSPDDSAHLYFEELTSPLKPF